MARRLRDEGVPPGRITIIHNWADGACFRPRAPGQNALRRDWDLDDFVEAYPNLRRFEPSTGICHGADGISWVAGAGRRSG